MVIESDGGKAFKKKTGRKVSPVDSDTGFEEPKKKKNRRREPRGRHADDEEPPERESTDEENKSSGRGEKRHESMGKQFLDWLEKKREGSTSRNNSIEKQTL
jgi:hypothetical protein